MIKEELRKEIEKEAKRRTKGFRNQENCIQSYIMGALDFIEKATNNPETNLNLLYSILISSCIALCKSFEGSEIIAKLLSVVINFIVFTFLPLITNLFLKLCTLTHILLLALIFSTEKEIHKTRNY